MKYQRGQVLLITLLVLSVATTIVLSALGRSTTDVTISTQIADSSKAFSAAEAGIEDVLKSGLAPAEPVVLAPGVSYSVAKTDIGGGTGIYSFPNKTNRGTVATVWLVSHNSDGSIREVPTYTASTIDVCWSSETTIPALIISVLYKSSGGQYRVARIASDPSAARVATNYFTAPTALTGGCGGTSGTTYLQRVTFSNFTPAINPVSDTLIWLRMQPVYSDTRIAVSAVGSLPAQGARVESSGETAAGTKRKIIVYQQFRTPPVLFDSVLYTNGDLVK